MDGRVEHHHQPDHERLYRLRGVRLGRLVHMNGGCTTRGVTRDQVQVLSIGCGDDRYVVSQPQIVHGGTWHWRGAGVGA